MDFKHIIEATLLTENWILYFKEGLWFDVYEKLRLDFLRDFSAGPQMYPSSPVNPIIRMLIKYEAVTKEFNI